MAGRWITVNGAHIFVGDGENEDSAIKNFFNTKLKGSAKTFSESASAFGFQKTERQDTVKKTFKYGDQMQYEQSIKVSDETRFPGGRYKVTSTSVFPTSLGGNSISNKKEYATHSEAFAAAEDHLQTQITRIKKEQSVSDYNKSVGPSSTAIDELHGILTGQIKRPRSNAIKK